MTQRRRIAEAHPGQKFGRLTVISMGERRFSKSGMSSFPTVICKCECGVVFNPLLGNVERGITTSCGCYLTSIRGKANLRHGHCSGGSSRLYKSWELMLRRCNSSACKEYQWYGERGVKVCDRWQGEHGFDHFLEDMGGSYSDKLEIDRIDNNGDYTPENCHWVTHRRNSWNRRSGLRFEFNGKMTPLPEIAEAVGLPRVLIYGRIKKGWSIERAISTAKK